jgi:hypothetical protein
MRTRKKELEAIIKLLEAEHEDVEDLAEAIWKLVDEQRRGRDLWVVAVRMDGLNFLYGAYESEATAKKDVEAGNIKGVGLDNKYMLMQMLSPSEIFKGYEPATLFDLR